MGSYVGGNAAIANGLSVAVTLPAGTLTGDTGILAHGYNPTTGALTGPAGWTLITEVTWSTSFHVAFYKKTLTTAEAGTSVTASNAVTQKLASCVEVLRGVTGVDVTVSFNGSVIQATQTNPTVANTVPDVQIAFWCERESVPSQAISAPSGFTKRHEQYQVGAGAVSIVGATNMTVVTNPGPLGGGVWTETTPISNDAIVTFVVGLSDGAVGKTVSTTWNDNVPVGKTVGTTWNIVSGFIPNTHDGKGLKYHLNRKAGTLDSNGQPTLEAQGAANVWAGTTGLDLVGALNAKAGNSTLLSKRELAGVLNQLAGTTGLEVDGAAANIA
jgi:hypothetical protein